jgi:SPP1 gp7 family putative phage head morphogenesis protein
MRHRQGLACDAETAEQGEEANDLKTETALAALLLLLLRSQRRMWKFAKEDLVRRLSEPGVLPAQYAAVAQFWLGQWSSQYRGTTERVRQVVEPAVGRLTRVVSTQVDRQLVRAGYQAQVPVELPAVQRKVRQTVDALVKASVDQAIRTAELTAATVQQAALSELPAANVIAVVEETSPAKRGLQIAARDVEGALIVTAQLEAFKAAGVQRATWWTQGDARVRPTHRARHGRTYDVDKGLDGIFPKQESMCRCYGVPVPR